MRPSYVLFAAAIFLVGIVTGLVIAIIIQSHILQMDFIYPTLSQFYA